MNRYPLVIMITMVGLCWGISRLYPSPSGFGSVGIETGWFVVVSGIALLASAAGLFRANGTTVNPTRKPDKLVTTGIYRVSRNPMYLGMFLILLGFPFVVDSPIGLVFPVIFFAFMDRVIIPREEKVVEGSFGAAYRRYKSRTNRWI